MTDTRSDRRVAIVTGSSRGIGRAAALALARAGHAVVVNGKSSTETATTVAQEVRAFQVDAEVVLADVSTGEGAKHLIDTACGKFGRIDILVNNAGVLLDNFLTFMTEQQWDTVIDVNLKSAFLCTKHATRLMVKQKWGRIVNVSSDAGLMGDILRVNYSAAKAGLIGFTKAAARELGPRGVTVNAIAPGYIETDMTTGMSASKKEQVVARIPMGRMGSADDVAQAIAFLVSDAAAYITGQVLCVDGGLHI